MGFPFYGSTEQQYGQYGPQYGGFWNGRATAPMPSPGGDCGATCDDACAGAAGVCIEPDGAAVGERWLFVGDGKGAYAPVQSYNYVGRGAGNYDLVGAAFSNKTCMGCGRPLAALLCVGLLVPFLAYLFMELSDLSTHRESMAVIRVPKPRYNCSVDSAVPETSSFDAEWLEADRNRDGRISGHELAQSDDQGQLSRGAIQALFHADRDGDGKLSRREFTAALRGVIGAAAANSNASKLPAVALTWTTAKRLWCCDNQGVACSTPPTARLITVTSPPVVKSLPFDCYSGYSDWRRQWSLKKREYCCEHVDRGCEHYAAAATTSKPPCKGWCCELVGRNCTHPTTTAHPFDCQAGLKNYRKGWSREKLQWCCTRLPQLPCPSAETWA